MPMIDIYIFLRIKRHVRTLPYCYLISFNTAMFFLRTLVNLELCWDAHPLCTLQHMQLIDHPNICKNQIVVEVV